MRDVTHPGASDLEVVSHAPFNAETPEHALTRDVTASRHVYVRSNFEVPQLDGDAHRIAVGGAVTSPCTLTVGELRAMPMRTVTVTMECAGNDRSSMRPPPAGEVWRSNAVSTARWTGVPLAAVLERAGVRSEAVEILAEGADAGTREDAEGRIIFARALPVDVARHPDTLLALMMNDEPLAPAHGAPVRLVVPRWYGMASVKWVARIEALTEPYRGYFQAKRYVYDVDGANHLGGANGHEPVRTMRVKSAIVAPVNGDVLDGRELHIWGWAWSGDGAITRVEVAVTGGDRWRDAQIVTPPVTPNAWTRWELRWQVPQPGRYVLRSRATDAAGNVQPDEAPWNRLGYGNNAVRTVIVDVR